MLRMARQRGVDVQKLIGDEYKQIKVDDRDQRRQQVMESLDDHFRPDGEDSTAQPNWKRINKKLQYLDWWLD